MGYKREDIRDSSPLGLKKINDNFMNMWQKMFGNINFADLDNGTKKIINSKVSQGDFETEISQLSDEISLKVSNDELGTKITQNWESVIIAWNTLSSFVQFIDGYLKVQHSDGSFTKLSYDGLQRFIAGTGKSYFYTSAYIESGNLDFNFTTNSNGTILSGVSIDLDIPTELIGKQITVVPLLRNMTCISTPGNFLSLNNTAPLASINTSTNKVSFTIPVDGYLTGGGSVMALYQNQGFILRIKVGAILIA
ncbi:MAG: hypothetical protein K0S61_694 [Anaerocolumna sp.]|jgi:hypothetical protein|nr:hypothetical protein [Anaerocolumna sp.]